MAEIVRSISPLGLEKLKKSFFRAVGSVLVFTARVVSANR